jgi:SAM-dependent methyltransferase
MAGAGEGRPGAAAVTSALLPVAATLLALAGVREGDVVVDARCGDGLLTFPAAAAAGPAGRVLGVDPDPAALTAARARKVSDVRWIRGDLGRLPVANGSADKVLCAYGAAHAAEWARVLRPGGRAAVAAWRSDPSAATAVRDALVGAPPDADPVTALEAAGLRVVHDSAEEVALTFATPAAYAAWRAPGDALVAGALEDALGEGPVVAHGVIAYAAAIRT